MRGEEKEESARENGRERRERQRDRERESGNEDLSHSALPLRCPRLPSLEYCILTFTSNASSPLLLIMAKRSGGIDYSKWDTLDTSSDEEEDEQVDFF